MDINEFEKIEKFLQQKWIPLFIKDFVSKSLINLFPMVHRDEEKEFRELLEEMLVENNRQISIKRLELLKEADIKRILAINN